ncbi:MAG: hypothetical protein ABI633_07845 [Burkholderiales bacterium]
MAVGTGIAIWRASKTIELPAADSRPTVLALSAKPKLLASPKPPPAPAKLAPLPDLAVLPPGVSTEQWATLRAEYADRPAELRRLVDHFTFADELDRFRAGRAEGRSAGQLARARSLDAGLDERLRERELGAAEARLIKVAVLEVLLDDEVQRREALVRWEGSLAPPAPDTARVAGEVDFQRRQAAIVAAWRALPADQRDPRALERELQAQRVSSFDNQQPNGAQR